MKEGKNKEEMENNNLGINQPNDGGYNAVDTKVLKSMKRNTKAYIWLYFISVVLFFFAVLVEVIYAAKVASQSFYSTEDFGYINAIALAFMGIGLILIVVNWFFTIALAVKAGKLKNQHHRFSTPYILFIVGIFINLCSVIAAFVCLSEIKKVDKNQHEVVGV